MIFFLPDMTLYASNGWFERDRGNGSVYGQTPSAESGEIESNIQDKANYIEKQFADFLRGIGDGITNLLKSDKLDLSLDGVVLGRISESNSTTVDGEGVSAAQFELSYGNPWGIVGSYIYVVLRSVAFAAFVIMFLVMLVPHLFRNDGKSYADLKATIGNTILMFALLFFFPMIVDWLLYLRDAVISVVMNLFDGINPGVAGGNVANSLIDMFRERATGVDVLVERVTTENEYLGGGITVPPGTPLHYTVNTVDLGSCFIYVIISCLGIVWLANYLSTALIQTGLFGMFPFFALLSIKDNRQTLKHYSGIFFINMLIPFIDAMLLLIPGIVEEILGSGGDTNLGLFILQVILLFGIIPARTVILRAIGRVFGVDARTNGVMGLVGLAAFLGSAAINAGRRGASSIKEKSSGSSSERSAGDTIKSAEHDNTLLEGAATDAKTQIKDVNAILGEEHRSGGSSTITTESASGGGGTSVFAEGGDNTSSLGDEVGSVPITEGSSIHGASISENGEYDSSRSIERGSSDSIPDAIEADQISSSGIERDEFRQDLESGYGSPTDEVRYDNLQNMDRMQNELEQNEARISSVDLQGEEQKLTAMEREADSLEGQNKYLSQQLDEKIASYNDNSESMTPEARKSEYDNIQNIAEQMKQNSGRIQELRGSDSIGENGAVVHQSGAIDAQRAAVASVRAEVRGLQQRNQDLRGGINRSQRIEQNLAAASGAAGMSGQVYHTADQYKYQRSADINRAKMATYKNFENNEFKNIITPQQRAAYAEQKRSAEMARKVAAYAGTAAGIAIGGVAAAGAAPVMLAMSNGDVQQASVGTVMVGAGVGTTVNRATSGFGNFVTDRVVSSDSRQFQKSLEAPKDPAAGENGSRITSFDETKEYHGSKYEENINKESTKKSNMRGQNQSSTYNEQQIEVKKRIDQADKEFGV